MDDRLNRFGDRTEQTNTVQYREGGSLRRTDPGQLGRGERSSESAPILPGNKAMGYNIRKYDTTTSATATEGFATGTDISFT